MANHKSAVKRYRQSLKARARNRAVKTRIKNVLKTVRIAVETKNKDYAVTALQKAMAMLDKAATKKIIHWKNAARRISRLSYVVNKLK
ncbi:30S ribosomal protein S20 [Desulfovibrionales bacterium]